MNGSASSVGERVLAGVLTAAWIVAVAFFWSVDPGDAPNRFVLASLVLSYLCFWGLVFFWSRGSRAELALRFVLTNASLVLTIVLLEGLAFAKVVDYRLAPGTPINEPWRHPDNLLDPHLLHIRKPHERFVWDRVEYSYDRNGLRNAADIRTADVVVTGDSFIEGWGVTADDMFTAQLAARLNRTVANVAQSWYGPQQELELLRRYGLPLRPQTCVWSFFEGNDLWDMRRYAEATEDWESYSGGFHSFPERSFTKNAVLALRRAAEAAGGRSEGNADARKHFGTFAGSGGRSTIYFQYRGAVLLPEEEKSLGELPPILRTASDLCRAGGARFLVVFAPTKFRVYHDLVEFEAEGEPRKWVVNRLPQRIEEIVREEVPGGEFLDLTPALRSAAEQGSLVYFADDTHWSPEGHRVAADTVAAFLRRWAPPETLSANASVASDAGTPPSPTPASQR